MRGIVTEEGTVRELVCHLCSRTWLLKVCQPYRPAIKFRPEVEAAIQEKAEGFFQSRHGRAHLGHDDSVGSEFPRKVRAVVDAYTGLPDLSPPASPPGNRSRAALPNRKYGRRNPSVIRLRLGPGF
jgi:hypothetical protein